MWLVSLILFFISAAQAEERPFRSIIRPSSCSACFSSTLHASLFFVGWTLDPSLLSNLCGTHNPFYNGAEAHYTTSSASGYYQDVTISSSIHNWS